MPKKKQVKVEQRVLKWESAAVYSASGYVCDHSVSEVILMVQPVRDVSSEGRVLSLLTHPDVLRWSESTSEVHVACI